MSELFKFSLRTRVLFGRGAFASLGETARREGFRRSLLVADKGLAAHGYVAEAARLLTASGVEVFHFADFDVNPDTLMVGRGRDFAAPLDVDSVIGLGGGSSLDCAKGVNFLLTNGGEMRDYQGYGKAARPLLPMLGVPTTAGRSEEHTSELQSHA